MCGDRDWLALRLASILVGAGALRFGFFRLSSGRVSRVYVDLRRLLAKPKEMGIVAGLLAAEIASLQSYECVIGVATGGIPWATLTSFMLGVPGGYVRSARKSYGQQRLVEGAAPPCRAVVVDDVATTGSSIAGAVEALRDEGYDVSAAVVVVDREQGARERLKGLGVELYALTTLRRIVRAAHQQGLVDSETYREVLEELEAQPT